MKAVGVDSRRGSTGRTLPDEGSAQLRHWGNMSTSSKGLTRLPDAGWGESEAIPMSIVVRGCYAYLGFGRSSRDTVVCRQLMEGSLCSGGGRSSPT
jgi:hypothetical protein